MSSDGRRSLYWARGISEAGNAIRQAILALVILGVRGQAGDLYLAEILETLGVLLMTFVGPLFVDRLTRRSSLFASDVLCIANSLLLFIGALHQSLPILLLGSLFTTFFSTYYSASLNAFASERGEKNVEKVRSGLSTLQLSIFVGGLVGLLGTSISLAWMPLHFYFLFDATTFLLSSILILRLRSSRSQEINPGVKDKTPVWRPWIEGFRLVMPNPSIRVVLIAAFFGGAAYGLMESVVVVHQKHAMELSDAWIMISRAMNRVGAILATLLGMWLSTRHIRFANKFWIVTGGLASAAGLMLMGTANTSLFIAAGLLFNIGLALGNPAVQAIMGSVLDRSVLGRGFLVYTLFVYSGVLLGNSLAVWTGSVLGTATLLMLAAGFSIIRTLTAWLAVPDTTT